VLEDLAPKTEYTNACKLSGEELSFFVTPEGSAVEGRVARESRIPEYRLQRSTSLHQNAVFRRAAASRG